jgi:16S rRNA (uracil1498-N3)-methyltransferase
MQRHRFFASPSQFTESSVSLDAGEAHHLTRVLRLSEGARVFVFNGEGDEWEAEVAHAAKREVDLRLLHKLEDRVESKLRLTLGQALIKGDKFDWIAQKATELGVTRIVPLLTDQSDIRRADERSDSRLERWRRISLEALKQCGRRRLVEITNPIKFSDFCRNERLSHSLICSEYGGLRLSEVAPELFGAENVNLCVGAEGGWSPAEIKTAEENRFYPISLGPRILRTETAAVVAVALAQHHFGDMK